MKAAASCCALVVRCHGLIGRRTEKWIYILSWEFKSSEGKSKPLWEIWNVSHRCAFVFKSFCKLSAKIALLFELVDKAKKHWEEVFDMTAFPGLHHSFHVWIKTHVWKLQHSHETGVTPNNSSYSDMKWSLIDEFLFACCVNKIHSSGFELKCIL